VRFERVDSSNRPRKLSKPVRLNANYLTLKINNMNCPKCNKKAISGIRFLFKLSPENILCQNCGTELKFGETLKLFFYIVMSTSAMLGFFCSFEWSEHIFGFQLSPIAFTVSFIVLLLITDWIIWFFGTLKEDEQKEL